MKTLYFDCFSGISGDMILGAFLDMGLDGKLLKKELSKLALKGYTLSEKTVRQNGIRAKKFIVGLNSKDSGKRRTFNQIKTIITKSSLSPTSKELSLKIFNKLAEAESKAHGVKKSQVHFHQVGDTDSIIDIVGACIGLELLGIDKVYASSLNVGSGISKNKGLFQPIPAPATVFLLKGIPVYSVNQGIELATPTGCAILGAICSEFGKIPNMEVKKVGLGAGTHKCKEFPNLLRVILGELETQYQRDSIDVIETNIDDMNPIALEHLMEQLFKVGALDVFFSPVQMKKMRMGILLSVLAETHNAPKIMNVIFNETTTLGLRTYPANRHKLKKTIKTIKTRFGNIKVKLGRVNTDTKTISPEYEDCKKIADKTKMPFRKIYEEAKLKAL